MYLKKYWFSLWLVHTYFSKVYKEMYFCYVAGKTLGFISRAFMTYRWKNTVDRVTCVCGGGCVCGWVYMCFDVKIKHDNEENMKPWTEP